MDEIPIGDIIELGRLCLQFGRVNRITYHEDGKRFESDTDHTVMLGIIACAFASRYAPHLDTGLISQFSQVHDFVEVRAGDTNTLRIDSDSAAKKEAREEEAREWLRERFGISLPWLSRMIDEYESLRSPEARFVKALDKALPKITHALNKGAALRDNSVTLAQLADINQAQRNKIAASYGRDQPEAMALLLAAHNELVRILKAEGWES